MGESVDEFPSALAVAAAIRTREVSPTEVIEATISRIDERNPALNAIIWRNDDEARAEAKKLEDRIAKGDSNLPPFAGVPIPIKDLTPVAGWPVTYGSYGAPEGLSEQGDLVTEALKRAGFIFCGRTNTPEFGPITVTENSRYGITRNPWNTNLSPGGSSGGAGAVTASGIFPVAHANDGGGSIRIPASCCGLVGLKPSRSRVPAREPGWLGMTTEGSVTRTVADTAAILDCISGPDLDCWYNAPVPEVPFSKVVGTDPGSLKIALLGVSALGLEIAPEPMAALKHTGELLEKLGHKVFALDADLFDLEALGPFLNVVNTGFADYDDIDWDKVEIHNKTSRDAAKEIDSLTLVKSLRELQRVSRKIVARWGSEFDLLVTPTMAIEPPVAGQVIAEAHENPGAPSMTVLSMAAFTAIYNITGLPAINVPLHWSDQGIPIGSQIVGGPWQEALLIQIASQLEQAEPWAGRRPSPN